MSTPSVFPFLDKSALPATLQQAFERSLERRGEARFVAGVGHTPRAFDWYTQSFYKDFFYGGDVPRRYMELGRLRLSTVHGCRSCNKGNRLDASDGGLRDEQIISIDDATSEAFDDAERAVLALADLVSMEAQGARLDEPTWQRLSRHFSAGQVIEMAMAFAVLSGMARFLFAFDLVEKEDYCAF
ncbi:MAG: carboxymuconolactone decarboxylase family protein [Gammaproteobacteria bacterium]